MGFPFCEGNSSNMITDSITSAAASISKEFGKKKRVRIQSQFLSFSLFQIVSVLFLVVQITLSFVSLNLAVLFVLFCLT